MSFASEIQQSIEFLSSNKALKMLDEDGYWPKWDHPWWHMLLLHEIGEAKQIPATALEKYIWKLNQMPLKIFPINAGDMPEGIDPYRGTPCHCQLGNVYQALAAAGVDVDTELPWIRPWFLRYQMSDGGLTCDNDAYLVKDEVPSSMVGTIAVFESVLLYTRREWTAEEREFLRKGADFLMGRKLMLGSSTKHNASERVSAEKWFKLCFPRYYFYDVLRGLNALLLWAEKTGGAVPFDVVKTVVEFLDKRFPEGDVYPERLGFEGTGTLLLGSDGEWIRRQPATFFPLLERVSRVGERSPFLSSQWQDTKRRLRKT